MLKVPVIGRRETKVMLTKCQYICRCRSSLCYWYINLWRIWAHQTFLQQPDSYKCQINTHNIIISNIYVD